jgi:general secretion pathway protein B
MSYILDALRRAEAERARERGKVPGLHDPVQGGTVPAEDDEAGGRGPWIVGGLVVLIAAVVGTWLWQDRGEPPAPVTASAGLPPQPSTATPVVQAPPPQSPAPVPATPLPSQQLHIPAQPAPDPAPRELAAVPAQPHRAEPEPRVARAPTSPAASTGSRILEAGELPEDVRRALPPLSFGGAMYSDTPSARLLIVNGQVLHEGDAVAKGVTLEQIRLKSAVMAFRGYRWLVSF